MRALLTVLAVLVLSVLSFATGPGACANFAAASCPANIPTGVTHFWFVDFAGGSDTNSGATELLALKHAPGMTGCANNCSTAPVPGDGYILKGGVVWTNAALPWLANWSGTVTNNIYWGYDPGWNAGTVNALIPMSSGYNCTAISVSVSGGGGSNAAGTANFQSTGYLAGLLQHITLTNAGSGYTSNPTVSFAGSTCTVNPTAVADIKRPVIDAGGTIWTRANGAGANFGPVRFLGNNVQIDGIEFRHADFDHTMGNGGTEMFLVSYSSGTNVIINNPYLHNAGPDVITTVGTPSVNVTGLLNLDQGNAGDVTVQYAVAENYEKEVFVTCGFTNGSPASFPPPCGAGKGIQGASKLLHNTIHDTRGQVYDRTIAGVEYAYNSIWNTAHDCCNQHEDTFYFHGGGSIHDNIIHDASDGSANFYIETCSPNPCTVGNVVYIYDNIMWNVGTSTPPIGFTSEFWGTGDVSPHPDLWAWNNTFYAQFGTKDCINAGQWFGNSSTFVVNFHLFNNHCISDQSVVHWYNSQTGNFGTWNGLANPNNAGTQTTIDAANTVMTPATATSQGYTISNSWAPTGNTNSTVTATGNNYTSTSPGCGTSGLSSLCTSYNAVTRGAVSSWQEGAYWFVGAGTPAFSASPNPVAFSSVIVGQSSSPISVTITNTGTANLVLGTLSVSAQWTISSDLCSGQTVPASGTCTFSLTFTPSAIGLQSGTLTVPDNAGNPDTVPVSGTGIGNTDVAVTGGVTLTGGVTHH